MKDCFKHPTILHSDVRSHISMITFSLPTGNGLIALHEKLFHKFEMS